MLALGVPAAPKRWSAPLWVYQRTLYTRSRTNRPLILELLLIITAKKNHVKTRSVVLDRYHRKSLSTLISSPNIVGGGLFEESRKWPQIYQGHTSRLPRPCRLIDIDRHLRAALPCEPRSRRTRAHSSSTAAPRRARRTGTEAAAARPRLQCINHGRRRAERHRVDVYAIDATPSTRLSG